MNLIQILMTPNHIINNIITFGFAFIEALLFYTVFTSILNITLNTKQKILYVSLTEIIGIISNSLLKNPYIYIVNILSFILLLHFLFGQTIKNTFIAMITVYLSSFICTFFVQLILSKFITIPLADFVNIPLYHILSGTLIYLCFFLLSILIKNKSFFIKYIKPSLKLTVVINLFLGIVTIFIQSYYFSKYINIISTSVILTDIISLVIYFLISMYSLIRTNKLEQTTLDLETEKLYNKTLSSLHDNIRCFKHDFNNIVQSIGGYIELNDMNGLRNYYKNLLEDCKQTNNLNLLNPDTINNPSIYSLLTNKYYLASEKGITMTFNIFIDLSTLKCNIYEFNRILGILLDNAIEAAQETSEKIIEVEFRTDHKKQLFIIENSCNSNNISISKLFEKGYSTKKDNSGIGLWKVHKILAKNTNLDLFTTVQNNRFRQQLEVFL